MNTSPLAHTGFSVLSAAARTLRPQTGALAGLAVLAVAGFFLVPKADAFGGANAVAYGETVLHHVGPLDGGRIGELQVRLGQAVKAGDVIATLDDAAIQLRLERARAELAEAEAQVEAARENETSQVVRGELLVLRTRTTERADRAELEQLSQRMQRLDALLANQVIPAGEVEAARQRERALAARVKTYDQAIGRGEAGLLSGDHHGGDGISAIDARVEPYKRAVAVQQAVLRELELQLGELALRAPVDGTVAILIKRPGDIVKAGEEIVSLVSSRPGVVVAILPERTATAVAVGQRASVKRDRLLSQPLDAQVIEVSPLVEEVPERARPSPHIPAWGRRVVVQLSAPQEVIPGEAFHVTF